MNFPLQRYKQIASVLTKYGFEIILEDLIPNLINEGNENERDLRDQDLYRRARLVLQELGPVFVKFGQIMSTRQELFPPELIKELKMLSDKVEPVPFNLIKPIIEGKTGPFENTFIYLNERPFAAASLSQAHQGKLKDGTVVVLKVQRPGTRTKVAIDLEILKYWAEKIDSTFYNLKIYNFPGLVEDFAKQTTAELDFIRDGRNAELLGKIISGLKGVRVPKIYWKYSGPNILVMEYIRGVRIDYVTGLKKMGLDTHELALNGLHAYLKQIFQDGFFHGDPHPGNLLVTPKGEIVFIDFGLVGVLRPEKRDLLLRMLLGILNNDVDSLVIVFDQLGLNINDQWIDSFKDDLHNGLLGSQNYDPKKPSDTEALTGVINSLRKYKLQIPTAAMLMIKVVMMVGDDVAKLDPDFNFLAEVKPYLGEIVKERFLSIAKQTVESQAHMMKGLMEMPRNFNAAAKQLSTGELRVKLTHDDIYRLERSIDRSAYRILLGTILASLVIGLILLVSFMKNMFTNDYFPIIVGIIIPSISFATISVAYVFRRKRK